jgi:hypothetical protein
MWVLNRDATMKAFALEDAAWREIEHSLSFPFLRVSELTQFTTRIGVDDDTSVLADFADWLSRLKASQH